MLVSKKLRAVMKLVSVEPPSPRTAPAGEPLELPDARIRIVTAEPLQVFADQLGQALAQRFGLLAGAGHHLLVDRQSDVHEHSICAPPNSMSACGFAWWGVKSCELL